MRFNLKNHSNINFLWSSLLIEELYRHGIQHFFVAPGSRCAPLLSAVGHHKNITSFVHFDERALAFMACGYAAGSGKPVVLICTSGTAAANFLPAIIEASKKKLPLIVITADRPPELQKTGAAQTIEQPNIYGLYVRWSFEMPCPCIEIPPQFILTTVAQCLSQAKGLLNGPVHLNMMFRDPLYPVKVQKGLIEYGLPLNAWCVSGKPFTIYQPNEPKMTPLAVNDAIRRIGRIKKGLILAGKISSIQDQKSVLLFAEKTGFPVFADITSGLRLGCRHKNIIHYFDNLLANRQPLPAFDGIIHFGGRMTSKQCYDAMAALKLNEYLMILGHPLRSDPLHMVTARYNLTPGIFTDAILPHIRQHAGSKALLSLKKSSNLELKKMNKAFAQDILSEPGIAYLISRLIPGNEGLFLSNSMPVRNMDRFASPDGDQVLIGTNRGASGIDGIIASAAGFAEGIKRTTTLLIGDLAFLYDLNSLALLSSLTQKIIIVVINNNGGEIFLHLPIASDTKVFEKYFITPHGLSFAPMAAMFNLNYDSPFTASNFKEMYLKALQSKNSTIIEIKLKRGK